MLVALSLFEKYEKEIKETRLCVTSHRSRNNVPRIYPAMSGASRAQYSKTFEECALHASGFHRIMTFMTTCHRGFYTV